MSKIITVILVVVLVVYLLRRMAGKRVEGDNPPADKAAEDMVRCHVCGVNLPRSEAILSQGRFYCCDEHRKSGS
ncbi:MAG: hypothetical protein B7Y41_15915 [Hydrogenophilales bacterium 28-61-23]|nr:MAG: hypothetical protein B7Y41_15915 [Hydrogenophilales bacterium 28-61-23]